MTQLPCLDPNLGDSLLDAARPAGSLSRDQLRHVEACASCRLSLERVRRLASTYRDVVPSDAEIAAARVRCVARARRRSGHGAAHRWHLLPRAVTLALLLAVVASAAAQIAARRNERLREASEPVSAAKRPHRHRAHARHQLGGPPNPSLLGESQADDDSDVGLATDPAAAPPAPPAPPVAEQPPPAAPAIVPEPPRVYGPVAPPRPPPPSARVRRTPRHAPAAAEPAAPETPREELTTASWQAAAAALRANDHAQAERALDALAEATDLRTRDAARLARAQLWLAQGEVDRARADLQDLAATGVTSIIRQSAREALLSVP